jgi:hypothetical protein
MASTAAQTGETTDETTAETVAEPIRAKRSARFGSDRDEWPWCLDRAARDEPA